MSLDVLPLGVQFEEAARIVDAGLASQRQLAGVWRKRQGIELDYARALARLAVSAKTAIQNAETVPPARPSSPSVFQSPSASPPPLLQQLHGKEGGGRPHDGGAHHAFGAIVDGMVVEAKSHEQVRALSRRTLAQTAEVAGCCGGRHA